MTESHRRSARLKLTPELDEQLDALCREKAVPQGAPSRVVAIFALVTSGMWLLLLPMLRALAQWLNRPSGIDPFLVQMVVVWFSPLVIPIVGLCWAAAFQMGRRGLIAGALVFLMGSLPGAYFSFQACMRSERALDEYRWTASIFEFFFTTFLTYPTVLLGVVAGFLLARFANRRTLRN